MIEEVFWIVLGRAPSPMELRDGMRGGERSTLLMRLLSSPEFQMLRTTWKEAGAWRRHRARARAGDRAGRSVRAARAACSAGADEAGSATRRRSQRADAHEPDSLARRVRGIDRRFRDLAPEGAVTARRSSAVRQPRWDNPEWLDLLRSLGLSDDNCRCTGSHRVHPADLRLPAPGHAREDAQILSVEPLVHRTLRRHAWSDRHDPRNEPRALNQGVACARHGIRPCRSAS